MAPTAKIPGDIVAGNDTTGEPSQFRYFHTISLADLSFGQSKLYRMESAN
jgi:hypothetical protein